MPGEEYSDDYVAHLLAKDAKASAKNYSSFGLQAFLPKRSINNAPKPNTRFLQNIIKETDNHNAALKAKEEREARTRLRELGHNSNGNFPSSASKGARHKETDAHRPKKRKLDEINGILNSRSQGREKSESGGKREPISDRNRDRGREQKYRSDDEVSEEDHRSRQSRRHRHRHIRRHHSDSEEESRHKNSKRHKRARRRSRSHSPRPDLSDDDLYRGNNRDKKRSYPRPERGDAKDPRNHTAPHRKYRSSRSTPSTFKNDGLGEENDTDPLESLGLIGPAPAPQSPKIKSRGRGALASTAVSSIDHHFKSNYDPTIDVVSDAAEIEDDWDQALEALKDRQQWQQNQAERLRVAGFSEAEISKWEKGRNGVDGEVEDVRWREKGEGREWDRGKVVDGEGDVETGNVEWGRLKGT